MFERLLIKNPKLFNLWYKLLSSSSSLLPDFQLLQKSLKFCNKFIDFPATYHLLFKRSPAAMMAELVTPDLADIYLPTLIVQGSEDSKDIIDQAKVYIKCLPYVSYQCIQGGKGHRHMAKSLAEIIVKYHQEM
jgi:pimeloyl-ACP methyl ester carboxylesterase